MNKRTVFILLGCFVFATTLVITLYAVTYKEVHERNSFLRVYAKGVAVKSGEMDIEYNSYYIAGITEDHIYLGNVTAPFHILMTNNTLTDSQHVKLHIKNLKNAMISRSAMVKIYPPYFYLVDGRKPILYRGKIGEWKAELIPYDSGAFFTQLEPIGKSSFAIRTNESKTLDNILGKVQQTTPHIQLKSELLQKQIDGIFCTDGILQYNKNLNRLIYTYFYRNEFIVYDTNLNLDYRGHTIDTFSRAQIKVGYVSSESSKKLLKKKFINIRSCTSGNYLFIRSNLTAKNDPKDRLSNETIIDVYDLNHKIYRFSLTLPNVGTSTQARDLMVFDSRVLIALYDHFMVKYDLEKKYF